ncbi:MAG TPA: cell-cell cohesion protein MtsF, partial [Myxococcaceae bacterium]|nr:cell-cell cohesion protein MtsF [Myxococcaceae bacterium]
RLTAPSLSPEPPPPYRLSYELLRPDGNAEDEERALNNILAVDLASARRVQTAGTWRVRVRAYQSANSSELPPGDLRQQYTLEVRALDEADANEGATDNDELLRARVLSLVGSPGGAPLSFTGRLGSVPDKDWYAVDLPSSSVPTVLHYRLVPLATGGRFPPLPGVVDRLVRVFTEVQGATATDCVTRADVCPKGYGQDTAARDLVNAWCGHSPPLCVHSSREESQYLPQLRNFEGALPVPPHGSTLRYYFLVQDDGTNWADDKDYRLEVRWLDDADEAARYGAGTEQPQAKTLAEDSSGATFPAPPAGAAYEVSGTLSHGLGRLVGLQPQSGKGVLGPMDYDAVPSDVDTYVLELPTRRAEPVDRTWALQWEVGHLPDGGLPHGLALGLTFCDGDNRDGGVCTPVSTGSRGAPLTLAYRGDNLRAWHSPASALGGLQPLYSLERGATSTKVTVLPYACSCLEPRFIRGGSVTVEVSAVDRTDYGVVPYTLRTAHTDYPKTYAVDGGFASCPAPVASVDGDGGTVYAPGCLFTRQP